MFGRRYFGSRYFGPRYFGDGGDIHVVTTPAIFPVAGGVWEHDPKKKAKKIRDERRALEKAFRRAIGEPDPDDLPSAPVEAIVVVAPPVPVISLFDFASMRDAVERQRLEAEQDEEDIMILLAA